jgi:CRP-like cAMP-binding protein
VKKALELLSKRLELFPGFSPESLAPLDTIPSQRRVISRDQPLFPAGSTLDSIFVIEEGWIYLHIELENGSNQVLAFLLPGQFVALGALLYSSTRWSVTAASRAVVLRFEPQAVNALLDQHSQLTKLFL